jgi:hypothetical protein
MAKKPAGRRDTRRTPPKAAIEKAMPPARKAKPAAPTPAAAAGRGRVYTLAVSLLSGPVTTAFARKNRSVVRTIEIRGDQTLEQLHDCIFDAFDRDDPHKYEIQIGKGPMDRKGPRYVLPMAADEDFGPPIAGTVDATTIDQMGLKVGRQFGYWFDFGDDWHHQIGVEKIEDGPAKGRYPRVVERVGASPPQYAEEEE